MLKIEKTLQSVRDLAAAARPWNGDQEARRCAKRLEDGPDAA